MIGENISKKPSKDPNILNPKDHPHCAISSWFPNVNKSTILKILEAITHTPKINTRRLIKTFEPLPKMIQIESIVVTIPLNISHPEPLSLFSLKKDTISETPDTNIQIPINNAIATKFLRGVNSMVIPKITIMIPEISMNHFID